MAASCTLWDSTFVFFWCSQSSQRVTWLQKAILKVALGASAPPTMELDLSASPWDSTLTLGSSLVKLLS